MSLENPQEQLIPDQERIIRLEEEIRALRAENEKLREAATTDPLTNALNRRGLKEAAKIAFAQRREGDEEKKKKPVGVLVLDIDNFKIINDAFKEGHSGGDRILQEAVAFLKNAVRGSDIVARIGGEEFAIVFNNANTQDIYDKFSKSTGRARLGFIATLDGEEIPINFSGGISMLEPHETIDDLEVVLQRADKALYRAKEDEKTEGGITRGRDRILIYNKEMEGSESDPGLS